VAVGEEFVFVFEASLHFDFCSRGTADQLASRDAVVQRYCRLHLRTNKGSFSQKVSGENGWKILEDQLGSQERQLTLHIRASSTLDWCSALRRHLMVEAATNTIKLCPRHGPREET